MRSSISLLLLFLVISISRPAWAQDHAAAGVFADYFRLSDLNHHNFAGLGGRLSVAMSPHAQMEGEMAYDFEQVFNEAFFNPATGNAVLQKSPLRVLHGLFGPAFHTGTSPWGAFFTLKGGFIDFQFDHRPATVGTFVSSVQALRADNVRGVLYPAAGIEGHAGAVGVRLEIGDEIFFLDGGHNNLRITFGPFLRF